MNTPALGWAVIDPKGMIDIRTVHDSERGAVVNWLYVVQKVLITNDWSDRKIYEAWFARKGEYHVVPVRIMVQSA